MRNNTNCENEMKMCERRNVVHTQLRIILYIYINTNGVQNENDYLSFTDCWLMVRDKYP